MLLLSSVEASHIGKTIIYQPQAQDFQKSELKKQFKILSELGFSTVILQWSVYGNYDFPQRHIQWYESFFSLAKKYHIKVIVGLYADTNYFDVIQSNTFDAPLYLDRLLEKNKQCMRDLIRRFGKQEAFLGWYLYDELNDVVWQDERDRRVLHRYLQKLDSLFLHDTPDKEVYISAYYTANMQGKTYIDMLDETVPKRWNILMQSAVGAGLIEIEQWDHFYSLCKKELLHKWMPILELFVIDRKHISSSYPIFRMQTKYIENDYALFSWRYLFDSTFLRFYKQAN